MRSVSPGGSSILAPYFADELSGIEWGERASDDRAGPEEREEFEDDVAREVLRGLGAARRRVRVALEAADQS